VPLQQVTLWSAGTGRRMWRYAAAGHADSLQFSPDGRLILLALDSPPTGDHRGKAVVLDARTGAPTGGFDLEYLYPLCFAPGGRTVFTASASRAEDHRLAAPRQITTNRLHERDAATGRILRSSAPTAGEWQVSTLACSPDGRRLITGNSDKSIALWDARTLECRARHREDPETLGSNLGGVRSLALSPDGRRLAAARDESPVRIWDLQHGRGHAALEGHTAPMLSLAFTPDGKRLVSGSKDSSVRIWDVAARNELRSFVHLRDGKASNAPTRPAASNGYHVWSVGVFPDGRRVLAVGSTPGEGSIGFASVRDIETGKVLLSLPPLSQGSRPSTGVVSPDGLLLAINYPDGHAVVWSAASGKRLAVLKHPEGDIQPVAFSRDSRSIATGSTDGTVRVWEAETGREKRVFHSDESVWAVAFSPDDTRVFSGSYHGTVRLWDLRTGSTLWKVKGHVGGITHVGFSPDGRRALSASGDGIAVLKLWDVATGREVLTLGGCGAAIHSAAFSPDGKQIAAGGTDGVIRVWESE
jgi:WD40 repeat protein